MASKAFSIKLTIMLCFIVVTITTMGVMGYFVFSNWFSSADATFTQMAEDINATIYNQVDAFIHIPSHINELNHGVIAHEIVDIANTIDRERFFVGVLQSLKGHEVYSFSYGTETGEYYGARRNGQNEVEIMRNNSETSGNSWYYSVTDDLTAGELAVKAGVFDPRTRDWYKAAKETQGPVFSPIYRHFVINDLTVSAAYPIYDSEGTLRGVLGTHIVLSIINDYLKEIVASKNAVAVIVDRNTGELVANSSDARNFSTLETGTVKRLTVEEIDEQIVATAYQRYKGSAENKFVLENEKNRSYVKLTEFTQPGLDWLIITAIPDSLFMNYIVDNMRLALFLATLALVISIAFYLKLTSAFLRPVDTLIEVSGKFSRGELSQRVPIVRNDEIGRISKSFNEMANTITLLVNNLEEKVRERTLQLEVANNALNEHKDQLRLILDSTAEGIFGVDNQGRCTFCNVSCLRLLGYKHPEDLIGENIHRKIHHSMRNGTPLPPNACKVFRTFQEGIGMHASDEVFWRADGTSFDVEYYSYPQHRDGELIGAVVTFMDNTDRKRAEEEIKYLSYHDSLTGLYNRMFFDEELKRVDTPRNLPISVIVGDMNGLKLTNDVFGHGAGDELIKTVAAVFKRVCRADDIISRIGGDEFAILLPQTTGEEAKNIIGRIHEEVSREKVRAVQGSISMGCDTKESSDEILVHTLRQAEDQMYHHKSVDRRNFNSDILEAIIQDLHERSPRERAHSQCVRALAQQIGEAMGISDDDLNKLGEVGYLHDIGKVVLENSTLENQDSLVDDERNEFEKHPAVGYRILDSFEKTLDLAGSVLAHHEKWDGTGYPKGLHKEEIPRLARIVAVAERYDSLTNRFCENPMSREDAIQNIQNESGTSFEPGVVNAFVTIMARQGPDSVY